MDWGKCLVLVCEIVLDGVLELRGQREAVRVFDILEVVKIPSRFTCLLHSFMLLVMAWATQPNNIQGFGIIAVVGIYEAIFPFLTQTPFSEIKTPIISTPRPNRPSEPKGTYPRARNALMGTTVSSVSRARGKTSKPLKSVV